MFCFRKRRRMLHAGFVHVVIKGSPFHVSKESTVIAKEFNEKLTYNLALVSVAFLLGYAPITVLSGREKGCPVLQSKGHDVAKRTDPSASWK